MIDACIELEPETRTRPDQAPGTPGNIYEMSSNLSYLMTPQVHPRALTMARRAIALACVWLVLFIGFLQQFTLNVIGLVIACDEGKQFR